MVVSLYYKILYKFMAVSFGLMFDIGLCNYFAVPYYII